MAIEFTSLELTELKPKVAVIGIGGAGGNAVNNMVETAVQGIDFIAANTDAQSLAQSRAKLKIQLGVETTEGLGAGSHPDVGRAAAEEAISQIEDALNGCHMVFITAGMGGGTGTGAAPVIAKAAKAQGILTVAVVTKPFDFEGKRRMKLAEEGIYELQPFVDTLVVIPNQNLFRVANKQTTFAEAFAMADDVLCSGVRGITDLMLHPGLINLDFADIKTIMHNMGTAMLGTGEASGEGRALKAAETAISNPLLDEMSLSSAKGVIINITGGTDLTLFEVDEAANHIRKEVDENANIIVGSAFHGDSQGKMRVSIVATGVTYLKKSRSGASFAAGDYDEEATTLHFEVGTDGAVEKTPSHQTSQAEPEPVGVVDDFAMPEAAEVEDVTLPDGEIEPGAGEELVNPAGPEKAPAPSYQMKEMRAGDNGPFSQAKRRSLFQESIEFVADEEDPPLIEEPSAEPPRKSLFSRMAAGIKGVFGDSGKVLEERSEPSMTDFEPKQEGGFETDNILNMEDKMDLPETFEDEAAKEETAADIEEQDDQLEIPSFLRKQA